VLSRCDAIALARQHLPPLKYNSNVSDDEIWSIIEFWSLVGRIVVHEGQVVRDPSTLIALLKLLLHHQPLQMMKLPVYHVPYSNVSFRPIPKTKNGVDAAQRCCAGMQQRRLGCC
jgi:hypothetical protein